MGYKSLKRYTVEDKRTSNKTKELVKINVMQVCLLTLRANLCSWPPWRKPGSNSEPDGLTPSAYINPPRQPWKGRQVGNGRVLQLWAAPALAVRYSDDMLQGSSWWVSGLGKHFPLHVDCTADEACSREGVIETILGEGKREKVDSHARCVI